MSYLDRLRALKAEKRPSEELTKLTKPPANPEKEGFGSFGSDSDKPISGNAGEPAPGCPSAWQAALARLDASLPPQGFSPERWRELMEDARWLADRHGGSAAALGWSASDLFGLDSMLDDWGGLADRLHGARRVTFTDTVAHWRSDEIDGWLWRRTLRPMRTVWEYVHGDIEDACDRHLPAGDRSRGLLSQDNRAVRQPVWTGVERVAGMGPAPASEGAVGPAQSRHVTPGRGVEEYIATTSRAPLGTSPTYLGLTR